MWHLAILAVPRIDIHVLKPYTKFGPCRPCVYCVAIRIARLAFVGLVFVPSGTAEWPARVDRIRWTPTIGDWRFGPSKLETSYVQGLVGSIRGIPEISPEMGCLWRCMLQYVQPFSFSAQVMWLKWVLSVSNPQSLPHEIIPPCYIVRSLLQLCFLRCHLT